MLTLKKLTDDHYVVVTDELPKNGDIYFGGGKIGICDGKYGTLLSDFKVIASTQPLECDKMWTPINGKEWMCNTILCCGKILNPKIRPLDLSYIKSLVGEVDVEKKAEDYTQSSQSHRRGFIDGYNQCLEDNKDKRFSEEDILGFHKFFMECSTNSVYDALQLYIQSLTQPKDTWEVEFIDGQLKLKG